MVAGLKLHARQQFAFARLLVGAGGELSPRVVEPAGERVTDLLKLAEVEQPRDSGGRGSHRRRAEAHLEQGHERLGQL